MKRTFVLFLISAVFPVHIFAEESIYPTITYAYGDYLDETRLDIVKELQAENPWYGQYWELYSSQSDGEAEKVLVTVMDDRRMVGGISYNIVKSSVGDTWLYRQQGDKVYFLTHAENELLIFDYGLKVGDIFNAPTGQTFVVKETGTFHKLPGYIRYWEELHAAPKMLRLVSGDDGQEEVWIEGIGSMRYGILPTYIAGELDDGNNRFDDIRLAYTTGPNLDGMFNIDEEMFKKRYFKRDSKKSEQQYLGFSFMADTLCITGAWPLNCGITMTYAECRITGDVIDISIGQPLSVFWDFTACEEYYNVNVRIPGFKAGTYQVGVTGEEHVTLTCNGTTGIEDLKDGRYYSLSPTKGEHKSSNSKSTYDLSGRHVKNTRHGVYIQNGKKLVK